VGSGSLRLGAPGATFTQCATVPGNNHYYFGYRFKSSGGGSGTAACEVDFYANGCSGELLKVEQIYQTFSGSSWVQASTSAIIGPEGTTHIGILCIPISLGYFDQLYLSTSDPDGPKF
jgi:hypothetical protein